MQHKDAQDKVRALCIVLVVFLVLVLLLGTVAISNAGGTRTKSIAGTASA